jgi:hypothetical protein
VNKKEIVKYINNSAYLQQGLKGLTCVDAEDIADEIIEAAQKPEEWQPIGEIYIDPDGFISKADADVFSEGNSNKFRTRLVAQLAAKRNKINNAITSLVHEIQGDEMGLFMLHIYCGRLCLYSLVERDQTPSELIPVTMTEDTAIEIIKMYDNGSIKWVFEG